MPDPADEVRSDRRPGTAPSGASVGNGSPSGRPAASSAELSPAGEIVAATGKCAGGGTGAEQRGRGEREGRRATVQAGHLLSPPSGWMQRSTGNLGAVRPLYE